MVAVMVAVGLAKTNQEIWHRHICVQCRNTLSPKEGQILGTPLNSNVGLNIFLYHNLLFFDQLLRPLKLTKSCSIHELVLPWEQASGT